MKRFFIYLTALTILASCTEKVAPAPTPAPGYKTITLKAVAGQPSGEIAKTVLNGTSVEWVEGDRILVLDDKGNTTILTAQSSGSETTFSSNNVPSEFGDIQYAFYPAGAFDKESLDTTNGTITLKLNDSSNNFDNIASNPSYAYVAGKGEATFNNICGILCIPITVIGYACYKVPSKITITSNNAAESISGPFTFEYGTFKSSKDGDSSSHMSSKTGCASLVNIEKIPSNWGKYDWIGNTITFYFPIPAGKFSKGFKITIVLPGGDEYEVSTNKEIPINKSGIYGMSTLYWRVDSGDNPYLTTD